MEYWECPQQLADRCARGGALCTARRSPAIPYRRTAFFGQKLPTPPSIRGLSWRSAMPSNIHVAKGWYYTPIEPLSGPFSVPKGSRKGFDLT